MKPKSKSSFDLVLAIILLLLIMFLAFHIASSWEYANINASEDDKNLDIFMEFYNDVGIRLNTVPFEFEWNEYSKPVLLYSFLFWMFGALWYFTTRKNYIAGKEHGTARWGNLSDVKHMFAESLEKQDIIDAKKLRWFFMRPFIKWKGYKQAKRDALKYRKVREDDLSFEERRKKVDKTYSRKQHKEDIKQIKKDTKEYHILIKRNSWKPDKINYELQEKLENIENNVVLTVEEKGKRVQQLKKKAKDDIHSFYKADAKILSIKEKYRNADMLLTQTEKISIYNYFLNNNTLILGGSGAGKTRSYVMPNILQAHSSFVITDPKGEILEKAGHFLENVKGYKIRVLNLDEKHLSDGYNPFVYIHPNRRGYEERVLSLIEAIIINTDGGEKKGGSDPFWDKAEKLFLQAMFFFVCDGFNEHERNMNTVLDLIGMLKIEEEEDNLDSDLDYFAKIFERNHGSDHIGIQQYKEFREKASGKTAKSIVISAVARLAPFRTSAIKDMMYADALNLDKVGEEKTAVFVVVPPTDTTFNFIAGMMFTQLFQELQYCATQKNKHNGQRLPVPVRFILDEFANTCKIPNFVKILAYARSFGIGITPILQSLEQIKTMYKDEWGVIVDNCNTLLFLGSITHMDTLEYMSKLVGKATFDKKTTGRTRGRQGSSSRNEDVIGRELMDASEIRKLPKSDCLLIVGGKNAFYSKKYDYTSHDNYRFTSDGDSSNSYEFIPNRDEKTTHGEYDNMVTPSENSTVTVENIEVDTSLQGTVNRMSRSINEQIIVSNDELSVDDGSEELSEDEINTFFDSLFEDDKKASQEASKVISDETKEYMENANRQSIVISNTTETLQRITTNIASQVPAPDDELIVDDGEETNVAEALDGVVFVEEDEAIEIDTVLEDVENLLDEIDNLDEFKSELA